MREEGGVTALDLDQIPPKRVPAADDADEYFDD
jgi:hypothetical protein